MLLCYTKYGCGDTCILRLYEPICVSNVFMLLHFYMGACSTSLMLKVFPVCNDWSILVLRVVLLVAIVGPAEGIKYEVTMIHDGSNWISYQQLGVIWIIENHSLDGVLTDYPLQKKKQTNIILRHPAIETFKPSEDLICPMMMHLFFSPEFLDRPARWLAQRASDHRGLIHGEFLEVHSQPLENHWLKTNLSKQTTWGANAWEKLEPSEPMIFYVYVYHVSIHACKKNTI